MQKPEQFSNHFSASGVDTVAQNSVNMIGDV